MTAAMNSATMVPVIIEGKCKGFILRCRHEYEAYSIDEVSLGTFASEHAALGAILNHKPAGAP